MLQIVGGMLPHVKIQIFLAHNITWCRWNLMVVKPIRRNDSRGFERIQVVLYVIRDREHSEQSTNKMDRQYYRACV